LKCLELLLSFIAIQPSRSKNKEFSLANLFHLGVAEAGKRVLYVCPAIEYGAFWQTQTWLYAFSITLPSAGSGGAFPPAAKTAYWKPISTMLQVRLPEAHAGGIFVFHMQGGMNIAGSSGARTNRYYVRKTSAKGGSRFERLPLEL